MDTNLEKELIFFEIFFWTRWNYEKKLLMLYFHKYLINIFLETFWNVI
jgi:hypothetical protein